MIKATQFAAVVAIGAIALMSLPQVDAIKCYICNSKFKGSTCLSPPNKEHLVDCPEIDGHPATLCRTMYINMGNEGTAIDRRCGYIKQHKECINTATFQIKSTTCQCDTDGCNPAVTSTPAMALVVLSALMGIIFCRNA